MTRIYLLFCLLLIVSFGLNAQGVAPGYRVLDSICLDENPDVRYIREILQQAQDAEFTALGDTKEDENLSELSIEFYPQSESDKQKWKSARMRLETSPNGIVGVFEIDVYEGEEIKTQRLEKNRVIELTWKLKSILDRSNRWDTEAVFLAECKPGHCYGNNRFIPITKKEQLPPDSSSGNLTLKIQHQRSGREVQWDLSKSLLETYRRYKNSPQPNPHQQKPQQCIELSCRAQQEDINVNEDKDFQELLEDYEFFVRHIELMIKQSLADRENSSSEEK